MQKLPQLAMRAIVSTKRTERRLDELMEYLGLVGETLSTGKDDVVALCLQSEATLREPPVKDDAMVMHWAKKLLAVTEEYLELVCLYKGDEEPWKLFMQLGVEMTKRAESERAKAYIEHARRNLRHVAYFYERGAKGIKAANARFPDERYSGKLLQRLLPM